jgi:hypothetical protein
MEGQVLCLLRAARLIGDTPVSSTPTTRGPQAAVASSQGNYEAMATITYSSPIRSEIFSPVSDHLPLGRCDHQLLDLK